MLTKEELLQFVAPDETAADFLRRQATEALATGLPCVDSHLKLRPGHVLELVGPTGCGKSELLAEVRRRPPGQLLAPTRAAHTSSCSRLHARRRASACGAPSFSPPTRLWYCFRLLTVQIVVNFITTPSGGDDPSAVPDTVLLIDMDSKFDPLRMLQIMRARGMPDSEPRLPGFGQPCSARADGARPHACQGLEPIPSACMPRQRPQGSAIPGAPLCRR